MTEPSTERAQSMPLPTTHHHDAGVPAGERPVDQLLHETHLLAPHELPGAFERHAEQLGVREPVMYLADLQQDVLVPFLGPGGAGLTAKLVTLAVDSTLAGRAYQQVEVLTQDVADGAIRVWLPLVDGTERLGVLAVTVRSAAALDAGGGLLRTRLLRFAALSAGLVRTKSLYGDTIVSLRRTAAMGLAAEMQWSLLPPLSFACRDVTIAAALEPAYEVAGDTVDYAVDASVVRVGVFDGMGHGLQSAPLAALAVAAYRNARRTDRSLTDSVRHIDSALLTAYAGDAFTTVVLAELDAETGLLAWANAGHPEPLLLRDGQMVKSLHTEPTPPLGLGHVSDPNNPVVIGVEQLQPGDRVLFYTDGVTDARSPEGAFFGVERLTDLLVRHLAGGLPAAETMRRVVRGLLAHQQAQLSDDASLLLLEWRAGNEESLVP